MQVACSFCDGLVEVPAANLGQHINCPHCMLDFELTGSSLLGEEENESAARRSWFGNSLSMIVSTGFHTALLVCCALVTCNRQVIQPPGDEIFLGELPVQQTLTSTPEEEQLETESTDAEVASESVSELEVEIVSTPESGGGAEGISQAVEALASGASSGSGAAGLGGLTSGSGSGGGRGAAGSGVSFMGSRATGQRFCIIADSSGSMAGPKLEHVKREILETVSSLKGRQEFYVVFFQSSAIPFPPMKWCRKKTHYSTLVQWLSALNAGGGTEPTAAFRQAFNLSPPPDAIFFMTDGLFGANVPGQVASLNVGRKKVKIHPISFVDQSSAALMQQIAEQSGGTYRHVAGF